MQKYLAHATTRRALVREFFYFFWWYYFPHIHRRSIPEYKIEQDLHAKWPRLLVIDARDHGKSAKWSRGYPLWVTLTNPYNLPVEQLPGGGFRYERGSEEILSQISYSGALAERWVRHHKTELKWNKKLIADWGAQSTERLRDGIWRNNEILLLNGGHIYSKGSGAQIRGDHPTELIVDDLEDRQRSQNPDNRAEDRRYFFADLYGALEPHSRLKIIGTIVHQEALLKLLFDKEILAPEDMKKSTRFAKQWKKFKYAAIKPDGSALAPEIWSYEALMLRKAELAMSGSLAIWKSEYMNDPESSENPIFASSWFNPAIVQYERKSKEFRETILPRLKIFSFVDPAGEEREVNDYTAIVTYGYDHVEKLIYCLEVKRFRKSFRGQLHEALQSWLTWKGRIGFEAIAYQSHLGKVFAEICEENHYAPDYYLTKYLEEKKSKTDRPKKLDKVSRCHIITHFFELGKMRYDLNDPMQEILIDDLKVFPTGAHDDTVDASTGALWEIRKFIERADNKKAPMVKIRHDPTTGEPIYQLDEKINEYLDI